MIKLCFDYIIELPDDADDEAHHRIVDALIDAVVKEGGFCCGGGHELGSNKYCLSCKDYVEDDCREDNY